MAIGSGEISLTCLSIPQALEDTGSVIFEGGVKADQSEIGEWEIAYCEDREAGPIHLPIEIEGGGQAIACNLRTTPGRDDFWIVVSSRTGGGIMPRFGILFQAENLSRKVTPIEDFPLQFRHDSVLHHFIQLAHTYDRMIRTHRGIERIPGQRKLASYILASQPEPYYWVESLISAATLAFDSGAMRLWKRYGSGNARPNGLTRTLNVLRQAQHPETPKRDYTRFEATYVQAKEYRDCIQHYVPVTNSILPFARMEDRSNGIWSAVCLLPDNPRARSTNGFRFEQNVEALRYAWLLTNDVAEFVQIVLEDVYS